MESTEDDQFLLDLPVHVGGGKLMNDNEKSPDAPAKSTSVFTSAPVKSSESATPPVKTTGPPAKTPSKASAPKKTKKPLGPKKPALSGFETGVAIPKEIELDLEESYDFEGIEIPVVSRGVAIEVKERIPNPQYVIRQQHKEFVELKAFKWLEDRLPKLISNFLIPSEYLSPKYDLFEYCGVAYATYNHQKRLEMWPKKVAEAKASGASGVFGEEDYGVSEEGKGEETSIKGKPKRVYVALMAVPIALSL